MSLIKTLFFLLNKISNLSLDLNCQKMTRKLEFINEYNHTVSDSSATSSTTSISSDSTHTLHSNTSIDSSKSSSFETELEHAELAKIVTTFNELQSLKPRSRMPIDIQSLKNELRQDPGLNYSKSTTRSYNITTKTSPEQRKYFSFMTTNKQITNLTETRRSLNTSEIKHFEQYTENSIKLNNRYSSTSSSSTTSSNTDVDSGCGSSIINTNKYFQKTNSLEESTETKRPLAKNIDKSLDIIQKKPRAKYITILFDYETTCRSFNGSVSRFSVKKGERVRIMREYERDFLIATIAEGRVGFVPKDYTVDLKEVEKRFKLNLKQQRVGSRAFTNNASNSMREDYENLKLTHL